MMPKTASPILIFLSDSNLFISEKGNYNNVLMQYNRVNISLYVIDLYNYSETINLNTLGFVHSINTMKYICQFTNGEYISEKYLCNLLDIPIINKFTKNILDFTSHCPYSKNKNKLENNTFSANKCAECTNSISIFFCNKPIHTIKINESLKFKNDELKVFKNKSISDLGFNFLSLDSNKLIPIFCLLILYLY